MAMAASTSLRISITLQCSRNNAFFVDRPFSRTNLPFPRHRSSSSLLTFARRRSKPHRPATTSSNKKKQKRDDEEDEDLDEDAFEALFRQLEEDLKNDKLSLDDDDDDEITEEDLANLERELEEALKDDELSGVFESIVDGEIKNVAEEEEEEEEEEGEVAAAIKGDEDDDDDEEDEDEDEDEKPVRLRNWQLKRLAYALKDGRRKTSIKNLAADVCLDRAVVLELLRDPPPHLVLLSAALPDKPISTISEPPSIPLETVPLEEATDTAETKTTVEMPVHVMQRNWAAKKRIKKKQLETLELVYRRSQRPTNAMISSIVHVTNLPHKRVVKWFEDKRAGDGVPDHHIPKLPYRRSAAPEIPPS
ncbi:PREDICTED: protein OVEREXPRESSOR OF CATIONIC PEROXIDASE 3-like [Ipomoea nil]|uniref:protein OVEREXPRESSOR OF CATIONIC PEROXIDASE 3-like n=1 Tax=Ipomoea nil TaxID=35883 RepID=UPI0009012885|nr:PREDICTED: protein OVEREXPRESSOR OF CATIONIC PEROXIDASE 3-like [Ipomoea nil]XP_019153789.1 PREDICTED: protein OVEREXPRESSOR OF CATIONIC PEROXIDASE 3-like [Ipomoea nil]XP_019153790.1 PREDICTED: protein OVEREXPRESSOR OF CATIONIC PEROXIDASE 3-like [Ipomoea nil]